MAVLLYGKPVVEEIERRLMPEIDELKARHGTTPSLVVVQVGDDPASTRYVGRKIQSCERLGMKAQHVLLRSDIGPAALRNEVARIGAGKDVHGVLVQLPLPRQIEDPDASGGADPIDKFDVLDAIPPEKDVDGIAAGSVAELYRARTRRLTFLPSTALAVKRLMDYYRIETRGKRAVVIGRNDITSKPIMLLLGGRICDASVTWLHRHVSQEIQAEALARADIVVTAVGRADYRITRDMLKPGVVFIDVATRVTESGKLVGDADFEPVSGIASAITPVPGGVGPITVAALMENTVRAARFAVGAGGLGYTFHQGPAQP
ncbi:bifunctional 5,10-methylenetetrahydrofolate dehydrogenase/5,10-methenyltetrahydrofolate cyclohydrolase [Archangium violaceum]|uniref:bifunctional 5,10-methylenetetrahydrofolate dehydrogenase/5,10-methenyltetrahydrofolate cyclohydrolase n=1 Tax=Archangium violaceum TaxID=83451 RepID=UPI00193B8414|nr:bifunctional 5,10-methylenetetrahydrofolate dehydrogenase/5,10-methenyltetrahydrofolate cyclohydrolase [Archangium violaceum]QRK04381.1 bifunctional 5,10-methylenetetrahydrofolate dehydrogenase/5,10-methenyltetrahydrofolate cyclohydrolase [Archangium violaceum]